MRLVLLTSAALTILLVQGAAAANLVQNGGFDATTGSPTGSSQFGSLYPSKQVDNWTTTGYNFVFAAGSADKTGAIGQYGLLSLWGPGTGSKNGLSATSPAGGNFIGADGDFENESIRQTISGLTLGRTARLSFWWAASQQAGFTGDTVQSWQVSLGNQTQNTPSVALPSEGFSGWMRQTMDFTPTSATEVLSFLAVGNLPFPPFALLDGVSLTSSAVPEPASCTILGFGLAGLGSLARWRRRRGGDAST